MIQALLMRAPDYVSENVVMFWSRHVGNSVVFQQDAPVNRLMPGVTKKV